MLKVMLLSQIRNCSFAQISLNISKRLEFCQNVLKYNGIFEKTNKQTALN